MQGRDIEMRGIVPSALAQELEACDQAFLSDLGLERSADGSVLRIDDRGAAPADAFGRLDGMTRQSLAQMIVQCDRVILATVIVTLVVAIVDLKQVIPVLTFAAGALLDVSPYLAVSAMFVAILAATGAERLVERLFTGHQFGAIVLASLLGAALPMCSTTIVPLIAALLVAQVPLAPIVAFWIASPLMDPENFIMTMGVLGLPWAIIRLIAAILLGIGAGVLTMALPQRWFRDVLSRGTMTIGNNPWMIQSCGSASCGGDTREINWAFWRDADRRARFFSQGVALAWFLGKWLALAFLLEALLIAYVPGDTVLNLVGGSAWWAIPVSALVGIPTYLNGYAALPLIDGLLAKGMTPGAALAFLIAGEITSLPTAVAVFAVVRKRIFLYYVVLGIGGAIVAGFALLMSGLSLGH
jgi:uncharacterized membrane protein YraQ (UPF0718 family)